VLAAAAVTYIVICLGAMMWHEMLEHPSSEWYYTLVSLCPPLAWLRLLSLSRQQRSYTDQWHQPQRSQPTPSSVLFVPVDEVDETDTDNMMDSKRSLQQQQHRQQQLEQHQHQPQHRQSQLQKSAAEPTVTPRMPMDPRRVGRPMLGHWESGDWTRKDGGKWQGKRDDPSINGSWSFAGDGVFGEPVCATWPDTLPVPPTPYSPNGAYIVLNPGDAKQVHLQLW
jgi:hypothetical protein